MDLGGLWGYATGQGGQDLMSGLGNLWGGVSSAVNNSSINNQVQPQLQSNTSALQAQLQGLQQQQQQAEQQWQDQYKTAQGDVTSQNQQLQGQIDQGTANYSALSDPNSDYMKMARQAIERKDAAAGRNSQWGDRETQLASDLAQRVAQYGPGMQDAITRARSQIQNNNSGLANLYNTAYQPTRDNIAAQIAAVQAQMKNADAVNTTGRQAQNAQSFGIGNLFKSGGQLLGGIGSLANLFTGGGGGDPTSTAGNFSVPQTLGDGSSGYNGSTGSAYDSAPTTGITPDFMSQWNNSIGIPDNSSGLSIDTSMDNIQW